MVSRREKLSRSFIKLREQIFERQLALLADDEPHNQMSLAEMSAVLEANHGPTVYDKIHSHPDSEQHAYDDFELIISRIAGEIKEGSSQILKDNPLRKKSTESKPEVTYSRIFSDTSQSDSDDSFIHSRLKSSHGHGLSKKSHSSKNKDIKNKSSPLDKKSGKHKSKATVQSDSSLDSSEVERQFTRLSPRKDHSKKLSTDMIYSDTDSDSTHNKLKKVGRSGSKTKSKQVFFIF
jgi:hypothetical protein